MGKIKFVKKTIRASKNDQFKAIPTILRIPIIFLASIGDIVLTTLKGILFVLNKAFSNTTGVLSQLVSFIQSFSVYSKHKTQTIIHSDNQSTVTKGVIFVRPRTPHVKNVRITLTNFFLTALLRFKTLSFNSRTQRQRLAGFIGKVGGVTRFFSRFSLSRFQPRFSKPQIGKSLRRRVDHLKLPTFPRFRIRLPSIPPLFSGVVLGAFLVFFFVFLPYGAYSYVKLLPHPKLLSQRIIPVTTQIFDRHGELLYEMYADEDRKPLPLTEIPEYVKHATIAIEDKQFYNHLGFSITGIARAARETFVEGNTQGGSTITQQLIRTALLTREVTLSRKLKELILAFWAERIYSKDEILEMYLNQVPYGGTAWGIEAAAQTYFDKSVTDLTLAEAAYLAGLPAAPSLYSPYGTHPEYAELRQKEVLNRMLDDGYITKDEFDEALRAPLPIEPELINIKAPHFVMYIRQYLTQKYGPRLVDKGGLRVTTTLDLSVQNQVQDIVTTNVAELSKLSVGNGAAVVTNPKNGDVLAMIGSKNYFDVDGDGNVNVALAARQPGSSVKPLMYAAALEKGMTAAVLIADTPVSFTIPGQPTYAPVNYDNRFHGMVTLRAALANSYNIPAVKTLNRIGVASLLSTGEQMGISTWTDKSRFGLALTLGGGETTLMDMVTAYGVLANSGKRVDLDPILKITDYTGATLYEKKVQEVPQVISPATAFILSDILADNSARTPAFGPNSKLVIPGKTVAVKTGTTNDKRDNLTFGYTPSYVVGVWVGNNNNTPMDPVLTSGVTGAAPIWNQIMSLLLKDKNNEGFAKPESVVSLPCFGRQEYFATGTEPKRGCGTLPSPLPSSSPRTI